MQHIKKTTFILKNIREHGEQSIIYQRLMRIKKMMYEDLKSAFAANSSSNFTYASISAHVPIGNNGRFNFYSSVLNPNKWSSTDRKFIENGKIVVEHYKFHTITISERKSPNRVNFDIRCIFDCENNKVFYHFACSLMFENDYQTIVFSKQLERTYGNQYTFTLGNGNSYIVESKELISTAEKVVQWAMNIKSLYKQTKAMKSQ